MNYQKEYTTANRKEQGQIMCYKPYPERMRKEKPHPISIALRVILILVIILSIFAITRAEDITTSCWVLCQPGDHVNLRIDARKDSKNVGWLECGEEFQTDGTTRNGWIRVLDAGECECWIYSGYVVTEKPEKIYENYVVVARDKLACRRWVNGPQIEGRKWIKNGREVTVFYMAEGWAVTNLGYMQSEWLEVDPV